MLIMFDTIKEDILVVLERDPAARSALETLITNPGMHAILFHRINHWLWNHKLYLLGRIGSHISRFLTGIEIHPAASVGKRFFIDHGMGIVIGETSKIADDCSIYHGVTLGGTTWEKGKRHPTLENGVIIGAGAKILGPITLGAGSRIGSNAVVAKNVPPRTTVVGIPGHIVLSKKNDDQDNQLLQREAMAKKIGFNAYGTGDNMPDPVQNALDAILDHMHKVDTEMRALKKKIDND